MDNFDFANRACKQPYMMMNVLTFLIYTCLFIFLLVKDNFKTLQKHIKLSIILFEFVFLARSIFWLVFFFGTHFFKNNC